VLRRVHAYQATSIKDDLPPAYLINAEFLARLPNLLVVSMHGAGYDTVDVQACTDAGVLLVNQSGGNAEGVAEHALAMMLSLLKRIPEADAWTRQGRKHKRAELMGRDLLGKTVGIVGLGNIGRRVAELAGGLFRCRVLAYDPYLDAATCAERGAEKVELDTLLAESDVITIHCPRNRETEGMFGAAQYARMKRRAVFVNTARFGIHDEAALLEALRSKHLAGAGLDVWQQEPPPKDHPLLAVETVIASPHVAGVTEDSRARVAQFAAEQLIGIFAGPDRPPRLINPEVWPRYLERRAAVLGRRD
jgi:D-3-phosphoglycerate dehydrogenase